MFQISLRQLLILVAAIALAIVSMKYASPLWQAAIGLTAICTFFAAAIFGIFDRGPRQAFAIGLALVMFGYGLLILSGKKTSVTSGTITNQELQGAQGILPTTVLLHQLYVATTDTPQTNVAAGGGPAPATPQFPTEPNFVRTGHGWWALLLGFLGGCLARYVYICRATGSSQPAKTDN